MPGSGMSIEVTVKDREKVTTSFSWTFSNLFFFSLLFFPFFQPYLFGAIIHRDKAYLSICDQAMIIGLPWGSDLDSSERQSFSALSARDSSPVRDRSGGNTSLEESTGDDSTPTIGTHM